MSKGKGHIAVRTCLSCQAKRPKGDLLRLVRNAEGVVIRDADGKGEGRGAYVCGNGSCLRSLRTSKRLARAFRTHDFLSIHPDVFRGVAHARSSASVWE